MEKLCITDEPEYFREKRVLLRVDYNVVENGEIKDTFRIDSSLETIRKLQDFGVKSIVILSHSGRPKGKDERFSLKPVAEYLKGKLNQEIHFHEDVYGDIPEDKPLVLVENLRFWEGEKNDDEEFAKRLKDMSKSDIYVNDAFAVSHRKNASVSAISKYFEKRFAGLLMKEEIEKLSEIRDNPEKPFHILIGGAKVEDKIDLLNNLVDKADKILIGGAMAYTFLKAKGEDVGNSRVDSKSFDWVQNFINTHNDKLVLPEDHVATDKQVNPPCDDLKDEEVKETENLSGLIGYDIGFNTVKRFRDVLKEAKTIFWNGPLGMFECEQFECGTKLLAVFLSVLKDEGKKVIVGGGDTVAAIRRFDIDLKDFHFVSTGGGATLEFLAGKSLPGIDILSDK